MADQYEVEAAREVKRENDAHFEVRARLDGPVVDANVSIDRARELFKVRQKGRGQFVALPLSQVAEMVYARAIKERMKRDAK